MQEHECLGEPVFDPIQNVHFMMCVHETEPQVEIIWPDATKGPIDSLIQRHTSGITYHICYLTDNLPAALKKLVAGGLRIICISPSNPAPLFGGRKVSFYNVLGIGLIEILE
jgi:methylmalonyl-CoA/ethylmalonyl-CoA epimerase